MLHRIFALIGIGLMLMACTTTPSLASTFGTTTWHLTQLGDTPVSDATVTVQLQDDGKGAFTMGGQGFCNNYNAPITVNGGTLAIANVAATRRMCPEPQMNSERAYFAALQATTQIVMNAGTLQFRDASGKTLLTFAQ